MHIPDGFLSAPVNLATAAVSALCCAAAVRQANKTLGDREAPLLGVTGAFVFAAQMLNFPIVGGTSGHFLGAVMASILLGPLNACLVLATVLCVQCLVFADGGLTALGSNIFNMGVVGGLLGHFIYTGLRAALPQTRWWMLAAASVASWCSVVLASAACALELAISGTIPLRIALPAMTLVHAFIGVGEAIITCLVISAVLGVRPDLLAEGAPGPEQLGAA